LDCGRITLNGNAIEENYLEFAHNAKLYEFGDTIAMIYNDASDYPNTGNLYFECGLAIYLGIAEDNISPKLLKVKVAPNPFRNSVRFFIY
jgi:hypothetical protein